MARGSNGNGLEAPRKRQRRGPGRPPEKRDRLLVKELAAETAVSEPWIYRAISDGLLECHRYGRRITVSRKAFEELGRRGA